FGSAVFELFPIAELGFQACEAISPSLQIILVSLSISRSDSRLRGTAGHEAASIAVRHVAHAMRRRRRDGRQRDGATETGRYCRNVIHTLDLLRAARGYILVRCCAHDRTARQSGDGNDSVFCEPFARW